MKLSNPKVAFCSRTMIHGLQLVQVFGSNKCNPLTTMATKRFSKSLVDESNAFNQRNVKIWLDVEFSSKMGPAPEVNMFSTPCVLTDEDTTYALMVKTKRHSKVILVF